MDKLLFLEKSPLRITMKLSLEKKRKIIHSKGALTIYFNKKRISQSTHMCCVCVYINIAYLIHSVKKFSASIN